MRPSTAGEYTKRVILIACLKRVNLWNVRVIYGTCNKLENMVLLIWISSLDFLPYKADYFLVCRSVLYISQSYKMSKHTKWIEWLLYYTRPLKEISAEPERRGLYFFQRSSVILQSYYPMRYIWILLSNCS